MAVLLQILDGVKSYGDQMLLDAASATIHDGMKVGFIGRNGAGKSTLLRILLGEEELDSGEVIRGSHLRIGYLRQHDPFQPGESALEFLMRDSGQPDWKCGEVAGQFELKGDYLTGPVRDLSGGWQTRVKLAALLLHDPNLLMLDEPTNFLDLRTQILLEHFLRDFSASCLIVSHDREFLTATCDQTLDLARGKLTMYPGKVGPYLEKIEEDRIRDERTNAAVIAKQKQLQRFIDKNRARATSASQARSKQKQLDRLQTIDIETDQPTAYIKAPVVEPRQGPAVRCLDLAIGYPDHIVASGIDLEVEHQQRAAIVGDNGQGKTTLLRTLVDSLKPRSGQVKWGYGCKIGVYAQHVYTTLPEDRTVLEYLEYNSMPGVTTQDCLNVAGALLFRGGHVNKSVRVLSGGERARLCMAGLLLGDYNILILDEPGNHLDVETVEALASALEVYKGTVLFTSHDRHFVRRIATNVIEVRDGRARNYSGDYEAYLYYVNKEIEDGERERAAGRLSAPPAQKQATAKPKELSGKDQHAARKQLRNLEKAIARLDEQKKALSAEMLQTADPDRAMQLHTQVESLQSELAEAEEKWCELQEELGEW
ncbi:MAG: ABC-F family ATP-binding cassette domain-containing protein [Planctomycetaceae bacterium]|nr:ABC-F family ATP-binding cassette domain-containing protein [Planctomycetaceae bacterium]